MVWRYATLYTGATQLWIHPTKEILASICYIDISLVGEAANGADDADDAIWTTLTEN
jgi:hypothetical protein